MAAGSRKPIGSCRFPETAWRPLGKGYWSFPELFLRYCSRGNRSGENPDLARGLDALEVPEAQGIVRAVGNRPRCLIEGITCAHNATALHRYLSRMGVAEPNIHAVDIIDVDKVGQAVGIPLAGVEFRVGDATNLVGWVDQSVQILVQDHLLNCCPHGSHAAVVREAARVLDLKGVLILNFSVDPPGGHAALSRQAVERLLVAPWSDEAYCLEDMAGGPQLEKARPLLLGRAIQETGQRQVLVTPPHGNFEFYSSYGALEQLLERFGLRFVFVSSTRARNGDGAGFLRYHTLVQHARRR